MKPIFFLKFPAEGGCICLGWQHKWLFIVPRLKSSIQAVPRLYVVVNKTILFLATLHLHSLKAGLWCYVKTCQDWLIPKKCNIIFLFSLAFCSLILTLFFMEVEIDGKSGVLLQITCEITQSDLKLFPFQSFETMWWRLHPFSSLEQYSLILELFPRVGDRSSLYQINGE